MAGIVISALYGLTHSIVTQPPYSLLVAAVIASAMVPTLIAHAAFLPTHLLPVALKLKVEVNRPSKNKSVRRETGNGKELDEEG